MNDVSLRRKIEGATPAFIFLAVLYGALLIISNITVVKLVKVGPFLLTAAFFTYPAVYVISDIMTEIYGYRLSMKAIWANFTAQALVAGVLAFTRMLPGQDPQIAAAMDVLFASTWRIVVGSLAAYWIGDYMNSVIMSRMKVVQKGKWFFIRAMASSLPAHFVDTVLFNVVAFAGVWSSGDIVRNALSESSLASVYELVLFPLTYVIVRAWKRLEGIDVYDEGVRYVPF
ncbi:MAG: queuosine precursor transporter [Spirochaetaceae bacterium]|nr:queuosine precursor transporter [Spirochaetaceae bacterium]